MKYEIKENRVVFEHPYEPTFMVAPDKLVYVQSMQIYDPSNDELRISHIIYYIDQEKKLRHNNFNFWGKWEEEKEYTDGKYWDDFIFQWNKYSATLSILDLKPRKNYYPTNALRYVINHEYLERYENRDDLDGKKLIIHLKFPNEGIKLSFNNDIDRYNTYQQLKSSDMGCYTE